MKRIFSLHQILALVLTLTALPGLVRAQFQKPDVSMPSPNAASLGLYGEVPVSLYTGTPNIDIPLYTIEEGKIKVPISLSYHASGVRVNQHPGWVGMNWNLNAGGAITRTIKDHWDELATTWDFDNQNSLKHYGYYFTGKYFKNANWNSKSFVESLYTTAIDGQPLINVDKEPDEFSFNFLGYSGKFYLNEDRNWIVDCDADIKVELLRNRFMLPGKDLKFRSIMSESRTDYYLFYSFSGFILTTPDGTRYEFGGEDSAVEYTVPFFASGAIDNLAYRCAGAEWIINTWHLKKITTREKDQVIFKYETAKYKEGKFIASFYRAHQIINSTNSVTGEQSGNSCRDTQWSTFSDSTNAYNGSLIRPTYLKEITFSKGKVRFNTEKTNELAYKPYVITSRFHNNSCIPRCTGQPYNNYLTYAVFDHLKDPETPVNDYIEFTCYGDCTDQSNKDNAAKALLSKLAWRKLTTIQVIDSLSQKLVQNFNFKYIDNPTERLYLDKVEIGSKHPNDLCNHFYKFSYHKNTSNPLPNYLDESDQTDHWGFFNKNSFDIRSFNESKYSQYITHKNATSNLAVRMEGSLSKIDYPTGGSSSFAYEGHDAYLQQRFLETGAVDTVANTLAIGGVRIKTISSDDGNNKSIKEYSYKYTSNGNSSSGILNGEPKYQFVVDYNEFNGTGKYSQNIFSSQNTLPLSINSHGSHIGYREVKETTLNNGYKVFQFTNYSSSDGAHLDEAIPLDKRTQKNGGLYNERISLEKERGKIISEITYSNDHKRISEKRYTYARQNVKEVRAIHGEAFVICGTFKGTLVGYPYKNYAYQYLVTKESNKAYDQTDASKSVTDLTEYQYNSIGLPSEIKTTRNGKTKRVLTKYSIDYSPLRGDPFWGGKTGLPIEQQIWSNESGVDGVIDGFYNEYGNFNLGDTVIFELKQTRRFVTLTPETNVSFSKIENTAITGIHPKYSKVIVNYDSYNKKVELTKFTDQNGVVTELEWYTATKAGLLKKKTVGGLTTEYDHYPLVGLASQKDLGKNIATFYAYDGFNRLSEVRDQNQNLIQSYTYRYKNSSGCSTPTLTAGTDVSPQDPFAPISTTCPAPVVSVSPMNLSTPGQVTLTATSVPTGSTVTWKNQAGTTVGTGATLVITVSQTTTFTATITKDGCLSNPSNAVTVTVGGGPTQLLQVQVQDITGQVSTTKRIVISNPAAGTRNYKYSVYKDNTFIAGSSGTASSSNGTFTVNLAHLNLQASTTYKFWVQDEADVAQAYQNFGTFTVAAPVHQNVLIVGNSITKILVPGSDWDTPALRAAGGWGMAASAPEKDYVHILESRFKQRYATAKVVPTYLPWFEHNPGWTGFNFDTLNTIMQQNFPTTKPDLIIIRVVENVDDAKVGPLNFKTGYNNLLNRLLQLAPNAKVVLTTSFWEKNPQAEAAIRQVGQERNMPVVELSDMRYNPLYKAANDAATLAAFPSNSYDQNEHPGDLGMLEIANRIWAVLTGTTHTPTAAVQTNCATANVSFVSPAASGGIIGQAQTRTDGSTGYTLPVTVNVCVPAGQIVGQVEIWASLTNGSFAARMGNARASVTNPNQYTMLATMGKASGQWTAGSLDPNTYKFYARVMRTDRSYFESTPILVNLSGVAGTACNTALGSITSPAANASVLGTAVSGVAGVYTIPFTVSVCLPGESKGNIEVWASTMDNGVVKKVGNAQPVNGSTSVYSIGTGVASQNGKWLPGADGGTGGLYPGSYKFWVVVRKADGSVGVSSQASPVTITITDGSNTPVCSTPVAKVTSPVTNTNQLGTQQTRADGSKGYTMDMAFEVCLPAGQSVSKVEVYASLTNGQFANKMGTAVKSATDPKVYQLSKVVGTAAGQWSGLPLDPNTYKFYAIVTKNDQSTLQTPAVTIDLSGTLTSGCSTASAAITSNPSIAGNVVSGTTDVYTVPLTLTACLPGETKGNVEVWVSLPDGGYARRLGTATSVNFSTVNFSIASALNQGGLGAWDAASGGLYAGSYLFWVKVMKADGSLGVESPKKTITITGATTGNNCSTPTVTVLSPANNTQVTGSLQTRADGSKGVTTPLSFNVCLPAGQTVSKVEVYARLTNGNFPNKMGTAINSSSAPNTYVLSATMGTAAGQWSGIALDPNTYQFYAIVTKNDQTTLQSNVVTVDLSGVSTASCTSNNAAITSNASITGNLVSGTTDVYTIPLTLTACLPGQTKGNLEVWVSLPDGGYARKVGNAVSMGGSSGSYQITSTLNTGGNGAWDAASGGLYAGTYLFWVKVMKADGSLGVESPKKTIAITPSTTSTSCATPTVNWISPATTNFHTGTLDNRSNGTKGVTIPVSVEVCLPSGQSVSSVEIWASMTNDNWARKVGTAVKGSGNTYTMSASLGSNAGQWLSSAGSLDPNTYKFWAVVNRGGGLSTVTSIKQAITIAAVASTTCSSISLEWHGPPANAPRVGTLVSGTTNTYTIPFQVGVCLPGESITGVEIWASTMDGGWPRRLGNATASGGSSSVYRLEVGTNSGGIGQWDATGGGLNPGSYKFWAVLKRVDGSQAATTQTTPTVITITTPSGGRQGVSSTSQDR